MNYLIISVLISLSFCHIVSSTCTFPSTLQGVWESPVKGNVTINSTHLTGYDIYTYTGLNFECHMMSGKNYIVRSGDFTVLSNSVNAAMCLKMKKESSSKYSYFILTSELADANYERVKFIQASSTISDTSTICDEESVASNKQETKLFIKYGKANKAKVQCPDDILGTYRDFNDTSTCSNVTYWDVCSDRKTMSFDGSLCSTKQAFSDNGTVNCVYSVKSGKEKVVYTYNQDDTTDESTYYRFTCMVIRMKGKRVYVTQSPQECHSNQTSTYVLSPGTTADLKAKKTCVPSSASEEAVSQAGLVAGMVVLVIVLLAAGAVVGYYIYTKKFKKVDPNEKRVIDKKHSDGDQDHRVTDAVTPSVVHTDLKSPKTSGSHGTRRHKRIGIKRVSGPVVPLPPVDSHITPSERRRKIEKMSLITPRTLRNSSSNHQATSKQNGRPRTQEDTQGPKVDTAPVVLQLPLSREETTRSAAAISRCSTIYEDKIGIEIPQTPMTTVVPQTPKASLTPRTPKASNPPRTPRASVPPRTPRASVPPRTPKTNNPPRTPRASVPPRTPKTPVPPRTPKAFVPPRTPKVSVPPRTPRTSVPTTPNTRARSRPSITRQSNISRKSVTSESNRQNRKQPILTVGALDSSKNKYVKYAKAVFKDAGTVYKKKIKLVGKIQKRRPSATNKSIKLNKVMKDKIAENNTETNDTIEKKTLDNSMLIIDMVKELARPKLEYVQTEPIVESESKPEQNPVPEPDLEIIPEVIPEPILEPEIEPKPDPPKAEVKQDKFIYGNPDENFFMCSNDEDNFYKEFMEKRKQEHEAAVKLNNAFRNKNRHSSTVPFVKKRTKKDNSDGKETQPSGLAKLYKKVESIARFSALKQKLSTSRKNNESKSLKESKLEQHILNNVVYNNDSKSNYKIQHRSRRFQRTVNLSRNLERLPTLVNWVECSDILSTPAMRMQNKINNEELKYDSVRNPKFVSLK